MLRQHEVGRARQVATMGAETVPEPVDESPDMQLGPRIGGANARHDGASLPGRAPIYHCLVRLVPAGAINHRTGSVERAVQAHPAAGGRSFGQGATVAYTPQGVWHEAAA